MIKINVLPRMIATHIAGQQMEEVVTGPTIECIPLFVYVDSMCLGVLLPLYQF